MSYPAWRKLAASLRGEIATCEACVFLRRRIKTCDVHSN